MNLRQAIAAGAKEPDLDAALRPIQEILGQDDGGPASVFFSGPEDATEDWKKRTIDERQMTLIAYVKFEMNYLDGDCGI